MEKRETEIAALSAAVAAGCIECMQYHKNEALSAGLTNDELQEIANLALSIRKNTYVSNRKQVKKILTN